MKDPQARLDKGQAALRGGSWAMLRSIQKTLTKALGETLSFDTEAKKDTT
jgi:hypothetical protein